ncbi:MAG: hypothetical protein M1839_009498 [Geoglossum umbratile]|nr:MAG: hypothetical protein M1839_009498 [Geoglossum umbratile]
MTIPTTDDEFERLPPAIRRKYFSTLERLRLAQQPHKPLGVSNRRRRNLSCTGDWRPRTTADYGGRTGSSPRRLRKLDSRNFITAADAQWFLELPETIRRKHFTREEQVLLAGRCESIILDPADEALYKLGRKLNTSCASVVSTPTSGFFNESFDESFVGSFEKHQNSLEMNDSIRETFRWMDEDDELDLSLNYHNYVEKSTPLPVINDSSRRPSAVRRTFSLSNRPFRRNSSSSSNQVQLASFPQTPRTSYQRKDSIPRHAPKLSISATDKEAAYYQDPEARLKLRVYLASPQKFDEAIEFGFPATDGQSTDNSTARPRPGRKQSTQETTRSFLDDNNSLFRDLDDASTIPETEQPLTPQTPREFEPNFRPSHSHLHRQPSSSKPSSTDSHYNVRQRIHGDSYLHAFAGSREMTLRMTLTRPDLRADESMLYGFQRNSKDDPLALEELPPMSEDTGGVIGPFGGPDGWGPPREDGIVKKLWKRVKHNGHKKEKA